jgi:small-conductance mechanosensitive channel
MECANEHRAVLSDPPAIALFTGFGDLGIIFDLKGYVANVFEVGFVAHEIRISIYKRLERDGVRVPVLGGDANARRRQKKPV